MADVLICPRRPTSSVHVLWSREPFLEGEEGKIVINNPISRLRHLESDKANGANEPNIADPSRNRICLL